MEQDEIKLIMENKFIIDCVYLKLTQQVSDSAQKIYEGSGFIGQNQDGSLSLKMYCKGKISFKEALSPYGEPVSGEIIKEEYFYQLSAKDIQGREWDARWILPNIQPGPEFMDYVITANMNEITSVLTFDKEIKASYANIYFPGKIKIPCNIWTQEEKTVGGKKESFSSTLDVAKCSSCDFEFRMENGANWLELKAVSQVRDINDTQIMRFIESLQFVLAMPLSWCISEIREKNTEKIRIKSCQSNDEQSRIGSPVYMDGPFSYAWLLFDKYLTHIINYKDKESWHPISSWIHAVIESGSASLDTEALVLSIAIEGLLREEFKHLETGNVELEAKINEAKSIIQQSTLDEPFKKRIDASLTAMLQSRAKDLLYILQKKNLIDEKLIKEYGKLRNPSAHGTFDISNPQECLDRCSIALMLFYYLIFLAIGYTGKYIDYSVHGFSVKEFNATLT